MINLLYLLCLRAGRLVGVEVASPVLTALFGSGARHAESSAGPVHFGTLPTTAHIGWRCVTRASTQCPIRTRSLPT
eukprot:7801054-Alexandrium_andersonii.AAC.1